MDTLLKTPIPQQVLTGQIATATRGLTIAMIPKRKLIVIKGWSTKSDLHEKYRQLLLIVDKYLDQNDSLNFYIRYELFNCATCKYLFDLVKKLNGFSRSGKKITMKWSTAGEEEDMFETGMDFMELCEFDFKICWD